MNRHFDLNVFARSVKTASFDDFKAQSGQFDLLALQSQRSRRKTLDVEEGLNQCSSHLFEANLSGADLRSAYFFEATLSGANLSGADLSGADLSWADLRGANLRGADLGEAGLSWAGLSRADLSRANLNGANLSQANLSGADLSGANLGSARLQSAALDEAILTGAMLWESQRGGWSIKGVICDQVYWDKENVEATHYAPGEFARLHSDQTRIELFYRGGITKFELNTLPALLHRLATLHPNCGIRLKSIEEAGGGAKVSIIVEDTGLDALRQIKADAQQTQAAQIALRDDPVARLEIEKRLLLDEVFPRMLASVGQNVHFAGPATQVVIASGKASVDAQQTSNDLSAILPLLEEFMRRSVELGLPEDQEMRLENAIRSTEQELHKGDPNPSIVASGLKVVKEVATKVITNVAEKALTDHWHPLLDQLTHFVNLLTQ